MSKTIKKSQKAKQVIFKISSLIIETAGSECDSETMSFLTAAVDKMGHASSEMYEALKSLQAYEEIIESQF